jgi:hypothetical protein
VNDAAILYVRLSDPTAAGVTLTIDRRRPSFNLFLGG